LFVSDGSASPNGSVPAVRGGEFTGLRWRFEPASGGEFAGPRTLMFVVKAFGNDSAVFASIGEGESRMTAAQRRRQDH
jgi:hypothetical protein